MLNKRIGIFGGTFAPVHNGHIKAAIEFSEAENLDKLYIVPTYIPPHKAPQKADKPYLRYAMLQLAFTDNALFNNKIFVSDYELRCKGKSYTYLTLQHFKKQNNELFFLCGTDMFLTLDTWKNPEEIFKLATIVHVTRSNSPDLESIKTCQDRYIKKYGATIHNLQSTPFEISSTKIRDMICCGKSVDGLMPDKVIQFIEQKKLYNEKSGI